MINKILKDIDNEECYYVGTNGCLYQDLDKEELLAIKQEIENLHSIIKEVRELAKERIKEVGNISYVEMAGKCYINEQQELLEILDKENK